MSKKNSEIETLREEIELMLLRKIKESQHATMAILLRLYKDFREAVRN
jgi:hypothetical protein